MENEARILVVDDEFGVREGCRRALLPHGFQVDTVGSVHGTIEKLAQGDYEMVLLDVMMPDGRGIDLLDPIHDKDPNTVAVIITGYATIEMAVEAIKAGAYDFIAKPFTPELLVMTVNQALERRALSLETQRLQAIEANAAELAREKEYMERLNEYKTTFTQTFAHELRSPVAGAQSLLRMLMRGLAGDINEQQLDILTRIDHRLDMLVKLINDLLTLATSKAYEIDQHLESLSLQPLFRKLIDQFSTEAKAKQIRFSEHIPDDEIAIWASEDGMERILENLIGNAIKYTPAGGEVSVSMYTKEGQVAICVKDTGIGIPKEMLERIGEEFFRAPNARHSGINGTGLGMSIVKKYLEHFGGQLEIESEVDQGTNVTILLPLATA